MGCADFQSDNDIKSLSYEPKCTDAKLLYCCGHMFVGCSTYFQCNIDRKAVTLSYNIVKYNYNIHCGRVDLRYDVHVSALS